MSIGSRYLGLYYPGDRVCWKSKSSYDESKDIAHDIPEAFLRYPPIPRFEPCLAHMVTRGNGFKGVLLYLVGLFWRVSLVMSVSFFFLDFDREVCL